MIGRELSHRIARSQNDILVLLACAQVDAQPQIQAWSEVDRSFSALGALNLPAL